MSARIGNSSKTQDVELASKPDVKDHSDAVIVDAVWGEISEDGPNYRNLGWIRASVLEVKSQIGLGVLALPNVLDTLGFVPSIILIAFIGGLITCALLFFAATRTDYVVGTFKLSHPEVYTLADVGFLMLGPVGREVLGFAYWLEATAIGGSTMLAISIAFNAMSVHGTCTIVFVVVGAVMIGIGSSVQTLDNISWIGWIGLVSIMSSLITLTVAVGVQGRADDVITKVAAEPTFIDAINAVSTILLAYAGTPYYLNIVGEMRNQKDFTRSVLVSQASITMVYLVIACVIYHYVGQHIASPALGSAGVLMKKICYGLALPGLIAGGVIYTHIPAKYIFVRLMRKSKHLSKNTWQHLVVWGACVLFNVIISFIIAEAIPFFGELVSLIGALLGTLICIQSETYMWMWENWNRPRTLQWYVLMCLNSIFFFMGWFLMVAGTYSSAMAIKSSYAHGKVSSPFTCVDNSNST